MVVKAYKERRKTGIVDAFYSAYFQRLKTLSGKDLEKVLDGMDGGKKVKTEQDVIDSFMSIAAYFEG